MWRRRWGKRKWEKKDKAKESRDERKKKSNGKEEKRYLWLRLKGREGKQKKTRKEKPMEDSK